MKKNLTFSSLGSSTVGPCYKFKKYLILNLERKSRIDTINTYPFSIIFLELIQILFLFYHSHPSYLFLLHRTSLRCQ